MSDTVPHASTIHRHSMRDKWHNMHAAQRAEHIRQPTHLYKYMSSFVPRNSTEGRIGGFFMSINRIGIFSNGSSRKFEFSPSSCSIMSEKLHTLILADSTHELSFQLDVDTLDTIMQIQKVAEEDFAAQGWSYNYAENFAYRTAHE